MSGERSAVEKSIEKILIDLMVEKVKSVGYRPHQLGECKHTH